MRYAIIAAGEGSRLHQEGIAVPKPLVTVAGDFQRALLSRDHHLKAWLFSKVLDIDHATDIAKAEAFLGI